MVAYLLGVTSAESSTASPEIDNPVTSFPCAAPSVNRFSQVEAGALSPNYKEQK